MFERVGGGVKDRTVELELALRVIEASGSVLRLFHQSLSSVQVNRN